MRLTRTPFPFADAVTHYARAIGLARSGQPDKAAKDVDALKELAESLEGKDPYWMEQIDIQHQAAEAWVAFAKGDREEALAGLRNAADREAGRKSTSSCPVLWRRPASNWRRCCLR